MKQSIVFAGGCFWGVQAYFDSIEGVIATSVGYANGDKKHVTYEEVCSGNTGFVEACLVEFDENIISLEELLDKYWKIVDPTLKNRQGNDFGSQYRTGIYYNVSDELWAKPILSKSLANIYQSYKQKIVTEIEPLKIYLLAEKRHQNYLKKNPNGYCHIKL
ncbi:peptide methionine sulfoxide reductase MsrA/MsrB [Spiroplasma sabaudiense Ar-1343]|uniref:Peptide methionine sulfoxide reductase MsrA n=1 Tax=Spiroplasma sabaudiense Ar-1343 TaxID=1276257 RepID=W6A9M2_9MOLU|nr:peptide-methionine (S)-S-oxide reductase MsrA [Spiroplasma sabaudiense]AHI53853.1 peptide methionine sulfoxide reductase MsrA/MsrB [Spiroplasma sabaudiense Ar-1343]